MSAALVKLSTLAGRINKEHALAEEHAKTAVKHARNAGAMLLESKALCEHGTWAAWLESNFKGSDRTARRYMQVAERWPEIEANRTRVSDLSLRGALELLSEPKEAGPLPALDNSDDEKTPERRIDTEIIHTMLDSRCLLPGEEELVEERLTKPGAAEQALVNVIKQLASELDEQLWMMKIGIGEKKMLCPPDMTAEQQERSVCEIVSFKYRVDREIKRWVYGIASGHPHLRLRRAEREADEVYWEIGEQGARHKYRDEKKALEQFYASMPSKTKKDLDSCIRVFEVFCLQSSLKKAKEDYKTFRLNILRMGAVASSLLQKHPEQLEDFAQKTNQAVDTVRELARLYDEAAGAQA